MSYSNYNTGTSVDIFGPIVPTANLGTQQTSDPTRDASRNQDTQYPPESYEKQVTRLLQQILNLETDRAQRQDHLAKCIFQALETIKEQQDATNLSQDATRKQTNDIQTLVRNHVRRSEQPSSLPNPKYTHVARTEALPLPGSAQYGPAVQLDQFPYKGNMQGDSLLQELTSILQRHRNGYPRRY
ncbi:hypothetical protein BCR34DRAFT_608988 [Clohesyomyces aquaticus]|uniref:Uncharacterized protein n=1 Tax=Clohesyomyces aquaticus TaxID=1231657 RepID=A0A1Y1Y0H0_9PLEO|nr:hypothetical protein BCR34DRAFT_608988 [Clohesyomyces aquaticus]